jgi:hypothetical protein
MKWQSYQVINAIKQQVQQLDNRCVIEPNRTTVMCTTGVASAECSEAWDHLFFRQGQAA